jgi:hypothetical protein
MIKRLLLLGFLFVVLGVGSIYSGIYPMGADVPHNQLTYWVLETVRERSIARAADEIQVPDLSSPAMLLAGGADYNDMCSACHLKPELLQNDMSIGLYPAPPNLALMSDGDVLSVDPDQAARRNFWIIKHGIKASGMPAWGPTHDDDRIWAMVAFLQKLPELTPDQYQIITARSDN